MDFSALSWPYPWYVIGFLWRHFLDILEILFTVVFLGVVAWIVYLIVVAGVGLAEVIAGIRDRIRSPSSTASSTRRRAGTSTHSRAGGSHAHGALCLRAEQDHLRDASATSASRRWPPRPRRA